MPKAPLEHCVMDEREAIERGMRAYRGMAARDHRREGVYWAIIPERRWVAEETGRGWVVAGWHNGDAMLAGDPPTVAWLIGPVRCRRIEPDRYARLTA